jgi:NADH-quinone oxidoreductase subunit H
MIAGSSVVICLFLGGWHFPFLTKAEVVGPGGALLQVAVFVAKLLAFLFFFIQVRWTFPRFRYDQLMDLGWKLMLPLALLNLLVTGGLVAAGVF